MIRRAALAAEFAQMTREPLGCFWPWRFDWLRMLLPMRSSSSLVPALRESVLVLLDRAEFDLVLRTLERGAPSGLDVADAVLLFEFVVEVVPESVRCSSSAWLLWCARLACLARLHEAVLTLTEHLMASQSDADGGGQRTMRSLDIGRDLALRVHCQIRR